LGFGVRPELGVALGAGGVAGGEEEVLRALEPLPQRVIDVLGGAACRLPFSQQVTEGRARRAPIRGAGQFLGAFAQRLLGLPRARALAVELGEVRAAATVERLAGRRIPLPQRIVRLAVEPADG